jgi:hypothetical protein
MVARSEDQGRLDVEDALGALGEAQERLRCVALRVTSRMRTLAEAEELVEVNAARAALVRVQGYLVGRHPQGRGGDGETGRPGNK